MKSIKKWILCSLFLAVAALIIDQPIQASALKTVVGSAASGLRGLALVASFFNIMSFGRRIELYIKDLREYKPGRWPNTYPVFFDKPFYKDEFVLSQLVLTTAIVGLGSTTTYCAKTGGNAGAIKGAGIQSVLGILFMGYAALALCIGKPR